MDSNDEPIYGSIGDLQATNAKIVETAQNILLQVSREYLSTSDAAQTYATQTSLELTDEEIRSDVSRTYVGKGNSGVQTLSSTMMQNVNGVNIYNNTLSVGDSYAHIDGNSFDIKTATTAGQIDDVNDTTLASFGREVTVGSRRTGTIGQYSQVFGSNCVASGQDAHAEGYITNAIGDDSHAEGGDTTASGDFSHSEGSRTTASGDASHAEGDRAVANGIRSHAQNFFTIADSANQTVIGKLNISDANDTYALIIGNGTSDNARSDALRVDWTGNVEIGGEVRDLSGNNKYLSAKVLTSTTISSATTTYTFSDDSITTDSVIDIYDSIFGFSPTGMTVSTGSCTVTFPAQSSSHTIKLFVY